MKIYVENKKLQFGISNNVSVHIKDTKICQFFTLAKDEVQLVIRYRLWYKHSHRQPPQKCTEEYLYKFQHEEIYFESDTLFLTLPLHPIHTHAQCFLHIGHLHLKSYTNPRQIEVSINRSFSLNDATLPLQNEEKEPGILKNSSFTHFSSKESPSTAQTRSISKKKHSSDEIETHLKKTIANFQKIQSGQNPEEGDNSFQVVKQTLGYMLHYFYSCYTLLLDQFPADLDINSVSHHNSSSIKNVTQEIIRPYTQLVTGGEGNGY